MQWKWLCGCSSSVKHFIGAKITVLDFLVASGDSNRLVKLLALVSAGRCKFAL